MTKKLRWLLPILLPVAWILATPTAAPAAQPETQDQHGTLNVVGEGRARAAPDVVHVNLGVEQFAPSLADARAAAADGMNAVIERLIQLGVNRADVQTVRITASPVYDGQAESPSLKGYRVQNAVSVTLRDIDRAGGILDQAVEAGAVRVHGVAFDTSRRRELMDQARGEAMADAQHKAEQLARLTGADLGEVMLIDESTVSGSPPRPFIADATMAESGQTPIEGGQLEVRATVRVRWGLEDHQNSAA
jgi:uncharacterized protein YggE